MIVGIIIGILLFYSVLTTFSLYILYRSVKKYQLDENQMTKNGSTRNYETSENLLYPLDEEDDEVNKKTSKKKAILYIIGRVCHISSTIIFMFTWIFFTPNNYYLAWKINLLSIMLLSFRIALSPSRNPD